MKKGKLLAQGYGFGDMLDTCKRYNYSDENTILKVSNWNDLGSKWYIYELVKDK